MADATQPEETPEKKDANRKLKFTIGAVSVPYATATVAWLVFGKMDAAQWISFVQTLIPICLGLFVAGNGVDKFAAR